VSEYRLIGYENRLLNREDFNNDKVDAGDIGAGHTVTAIYEITLTGDNADQIDPLRYAPSSNQPALETNELAFIKLRYKLPNKDASTSNLVKYSIEQSSIKTNASQSSNDFKFSAAVAAFGQKLRGGDYLMNQFNYQQILFLAKQGKGSDANGYRGEFIQLVKLASSLEE